MGRAERAVCAVVLWNKSGWGRGRGLSSEFILLPTLPQHAVKSLSFSGDGRSLFAGSEGGVVYQWDISQGAVVAEYHGLSSGVVRLALTADGQQLVAASCSGEVCQWACQGGGEDGTEKTLQ